MNWIWMPTNGFGYTNNAKVTFGPPSFEKTLFEVKKSTTVKSYPVYYL